MGFQLTPAHRPVVRLVLAALIAGALGVAVSGQDALPTKVTVRVAPFRDDAQNARVIELFEQYFEPEMRTLEAPARATDLSASHCGDRNNPWLRSFLAKNGLSSEGALIPAGTHVTLPPCPFWTLGGSVTITPGDTVSQVLSRELGQSGPAMLGRVARLNNRSAGSFEDVDPGDTLQVPFTVATISPTVRPEYRARVPEIVDALNVLSIPQAARAGVARLARHVAEDEVSCEGAAVVEPFDAERVASILEHNERVRRITRKAVVAVLDTGIDSDERRLFLASDPDGNIGFNVDRADGFPTLPAEYGLRSHGTHVAGLVLGGLNSPRLTAAVEKRVTLRIGNIVTTDVLPNPTGGPPIVDFSIPVVNVQTAITRARQSPEAHIINLSVETPTRIDEMVQHLQPGDYVLVVAAGNGESDIDDTPVYPARFRADLPRKILSVAAHGPEGQWAAFSNYGPGSVDLAAPGCNVRSTLPGGQMGAMTGTSQAAPLVSFVAALLFADGLPPREIVNRIRATVRFAPELRGLVSTAGRLDVEQAVSLFDDLVYVRGEVEPRRGLIGLSCIPLAGHPCRQLTQLARLVVATEGQKRAGQAWLIGGDGQLLERATDVPSGRLPFVPDSSSPATPIEWQDVTDIVFASRRIAR